MAASYITSPTTALTAAQVTDIAPLQASFNNTYELGYKGIVGNRFRDEPDHPGLAARFRIPFDPELAEVERRGLAPLDACPDSPAIVALSRLAALFMNQEVPV